MQYVLSFAKNQMLRSWSLKQLNKNKKLFVWILNCGVLHGSIIEPIFVLYVTNYLLLSLSETGSYLYAGNTCISYKYKDFQKQSPKGVL